MAPPAGPSQESYAALPVWRRISLQLALFSLLASGVVLLREFGLVAFAPNIEHALAIAISGAPLLLWLLLSVWPEYRHTRPRRRLVAVALLSGLCAAAIGMPLVEIFYAVERWLPLESVFTRVLGYTFSAGIVGVGIKFAVLRFIVYPQRLRARSDVIAYAFAAALGYSFYASLAQIWSLQPSVDAAALLVLAHLSIHAASSLFIALGFIAAVFDDAFPLALPANLLLAALAAGAIRALYPGLLSGQLSQAGSGARPLIALGLLAAAWCLALGISRFVYATAERSEREAFGVVEGYDAV